MPQQELGPGRARLSRTVRSGVASSHAFVAALMALAPRTADARARPLFEPTDLEMERSGTVEIDLQVGAVRGESPWRLMVPDVEIDVGLFRNVELDVDGAYAIEGPGDGRFSFDHLAADDPWVAAKLGLYDSREEGARDAWAVGLQLGPKLPLANDAHGIGFEGLLITGCTWSKTHLVLNMGGLIDPGGAVSSGRPAGVEGGIDVSLHLGASSFSLTAELGGTHFFSPDADELHTTGGISWGPNEQLDVSVIGLLGLLRGGDRGGVLLGVSPKFALW
jgi:hypothetical protein